VPSPRKDADTGTDSAATVGYPALKADFILANPPFNTSGWGGERLRDDERWQYGAPPAGSRPLGLPQAECLSVA